MSASSPRATNALPVYLRWPGALSLTPESVVLLYDWDSEQISPETDERRIIAAAVAAAAKYPELPAILPDRPPTAKTCSVCSGDGRVSLSPKLTLGCGTCFGLGWVS
jgi:hypothetical protein